jgi:hypothetical protein
MSNDEEAPKIEFTAEEPELGRFKAKRIEATARAITLIVIAVFACIILAKVIL